MNPSQFIAFAAAIVAGGIALATALKPGESSARWLFAIGLAILAGESALAGFSAGAALADSVAFWQRWRLTATALLPAIWLAFSLTYSRGNFRDFLRRWRVTLIISLVAPLSVVVLFWNALVASISVPESGQGWFLNFGRPVLVLYGLLLLAAVIVLMNLERTFRTAIGTLRWQMKYIVLGLAVLFAARIYTASQVLLFFGIQHSFLVADAAVLLVACLLMMRSLLRTGVFNVDVYPSHALLSASVTVLLAGLYLVLVGVLAKAVTVFGGETAFPLEAFLVFVALVGLSLLLLSDRLREFSHRFVSRHLGRPRYDYRKVWQTFTERTTSCLTAEELSRAVVDWLCRTFNVLSVTIWLAEDGKRLSFGASTSLTEPVARRLNSPDADLNEVLTAIRRNPVPVDIDASTEKWAQLLKQLQPGFFQTGGNRVCIPIMAGDELLGLMTLGDRVGGLSFAAEDHELLKCIGDQVGSGLLNLRLSRRLVEAKEMEAFQTMSAFFVHDLKNTAHTLSLMLQNLPVHFDNPAFREDALRAIGKGAQRLNDLVTRLTLLKQKPEIQQVPGDLNKTIEAALSGLETATATKLVKSYAALPNIPFDPEQLQKVVANLVLNALDAVGEAGEIRVETGESRDGVFLAVQDNGCGISQEFMTKSLFRPFQTTKKKGIGIGMYHCKVIVEAHRGRIEVESQEGCGTIMRVLLPRTTEGKLT